MELLSSLLEHGLGINPIVTEWLDYYYAFYLPEFKSSTLHMYSHFSGFVLGFNDVRRICDFVKFEVYQSSSVSLWLSHGWDVHAYIHSDDCAWKYVCEHLHLY